MNSPETSPPFFPIFVNQLANAGEGNALGAEIAANANPIDRLTVQLAYSYIDLDVDNEDPALFPLASVNSLLFSEDNTAEHLVSLRAALDVTDSILASGWLRYTSAPLRVAPRQPFAAEPFPTDDVDLDLRLTYAPEGPFRVSLIGENLLNDEDDFEAVEYVGPLTELSPVDRRLTAKLELDF